MAETDSAKYETTYPDDLTAANLDRINPDRKILIDLREEEDYRQDRIPGAVWMTEEEVLSDSFEDKLLEKLKNAPGGEAEPDLKTKLLVFYCRFGIISRDAAADLTGKGYLAVSLQGGYGAYVADRLSKDLNTEKRREDIEKSLRKKFKVDLFNKFVKAIVDYELISPGDHIAVCISGGKDSMLMAMLFKELKRRNRIPFELTYLVMDPGYSDVNREVIENNARLLGIPLTIFETNIFDVAYSQDHSPCYLCARMRRGYLYRKAKDLGCNKIALGHHYDDVIETVFMGMMYSGQFQAMMPKLKSTNFEGMELIRPMYLIREADIIWRDYNDLHFIQCACRFTDTCTTCRPDGATGSKRVETKQLIAKLKETNPYIESNIFKSMMNVSLNCVLGYKYKGERHSFLEYYDE